MTLASYGKKINGHYTSTEKKKGKTCTLRLEIQILLKSLPHLAEVQYFGYFVDTMTEDVFVEV